MAQRAGFGIADIRELLATSAGRPSATRQWRELAARKLPEIDAIIRDLTELRAVIAARLDCGCMDFENCQLLTRRQPWSRPGVATASSRSTRYRLSLTAPLRGPRSSTRRDPTT
jgi:hypothetical protein